MASYPFSQIEKKWQQFWEENKTFAATEDEKIPKEKRAYVLDMFPYPSAQGLHVGHPEGYTATDIYCRFLRMNGYNVLHPMGFDSFGLPAENYAIKTGTHPAITTHTNIEYFTSQIKSLGFSYDWSRCISTCESDYYQWTQWIFLQLFKKGLAYEAETPINFCPSCKTGLANEEVKDGKCDRCGTPVTRKTIRQWMLRITSYAERLLEDLESLDWSDSVKAMQRNWIGKSFGAEVDFEIANTSPNVKKLTVFTTRCDTLFGATYMVIAPEHPLVDALTTDLQKSQVAQYVNDAVNKSDMERTDAAKEKTGVFTGSYAINPMTQKKIPIWISDYVLISYGTGAIMAVPAHDERDWDFAKKFSLPVIKVVAQTKDEDPDSPVDECTSAYGYSINSSTFSGLETEAAKEAVLRYIEEKGFGKRTVNYKLRDWIFSRQRYWGEPIPLVHCPDCGVVPLDETELPLKLPEVKAYEPTGTGESPLANITDWVKTKCPKCGKDANRETNTMPQWAGSCWYYLRYLDAHNKNEFAAKEKINYWMPVDLYVGGTEHAVLHLLYARFWHKVLFDIGLVNTKEPFQRLVNQGMITSFAFQKKTKQLVPSDAVTEKDGEFFDSETGEKLERVIAKMSKSLKNVINPDDMIREYGADSVRMYEMFMGPLEISKPWNTQGLIGIHRFLEKVLSIAEKQKNVSHNVGTENSALVVLYHKTLKKVTEDTRSLNFNTAISQMMIFVNELVKSAPVASEIWGGFVKMLSPYAPHLAEELWEQLDSKKENPAKTIAYEKWPLYDESLCKESSVTVIVQVNGKIRGKFEASAGTDKAVLEQKALATESAKKFLEDRTPKKIIVVQDKLVNIVM